MQVMLAKAKDLLSLSEHHHWTWAPEILVDESLQLFERFAEQCCIARTDRHSIAALWILLVGKVYCGLSCPRSAARVVVQLARSELIGP